MLASLLLLVKFGIDVVRRLIHDLYFRSLGIVLLIILLSGTLFFWLVEGRVFKEAFGYSLATMTLNSPYGVGWGPVTIFGIIFNIIYLFLSVGIFLIFVLEVGKTMIKTYEDFTFKRSGKKDKRLEKSGKPGVN
jgi:hypothetical protein